MLKKINQHQNNPERFYDLSLKRLLLTAAASGLLILIIGVYFLCGFTIIPNIEPRCGTLVDFFGRIATIALLIPGFMLVSDYTWAIQHQSFVYFLTILIDLAIIYHLVSAFVVIFDRLRRRK